MLWLTNEFREPLQSSDTKILRSNSPSTRFDKIGQKERSDNEKRNFYCTIYSGVLINPFLETLKAPIQNYIVHSIYGPSYTEWLNWTQSNKTTEDSRGSIQISNGPDKTLYNINTETKLGSQPKRSIAISTVNTTDNRIIKNILPLQAYYIYIYMCGKHDANHFIPLKHCYGGFHPTFYSLVGTGLANQSSFFSFFPVHWF